MKERTEKRIRQLYEVFKKENPKNDEVPYIIFKVNFLQDDVMKLFLEIVSDDMWESYIAASKETEFEFDWSCLPAWSNKYIAMDRCGDWFCYESEPKKGESTWIGQSRSFKIPKEFEPKRLPYSKGIDWTKSLTKNPTI